MSEKASPEAYAVTHDGWGELVLSRPARRNAIVGPMVGEMRAALASLLDAKARVIVLRGDGGSFCSGARRRCVRPDPAARMASDISAGLGRRGTSISIAARRW